ncbi:MAG: capsular biosynthesis protein [Cyclobacteriaceae bacterium]|nr:capsular biosynthesis protein [Cyclobacteriaceae bacterium]
MGWFSKKNTFFLPCTTDIHSHLLPGIDDGVKTIEESLEVIRFLNDLGFKKLITTPHIMSDYYKNTPSIIRSKLEEVRFALKEAGMNVEIEAAAEYYLDEHFYEQIINEQELLTFGENYILFETSFTVEPLLLKEVIFKLSSNGYKPVFAHPERYLYLHENTRLLNDLIDQELLFQLNILSLDGYYSKPVQKMAIKLLKSNAITFVGSDCHNLLQAQAIKKALSSKNAQLIKSINLKNRNL